MRLRQEQVVFLAAAAVLGLLGWRLFSGGPVELRGGGRSASGAELERLLAPELAVALPEGGASFSVQRELFAPPRATQPLPPLALEEPPRDPLAALLPPPDPGPAPAAYGALLRRDVPREELPGLFDEAEAAELHGDDGAGDEGGSVLDDLRRLGEMETATLTPEERTARREAWKEEYDWWTNQVEYFFGRIRNRDRYGLATDVERADEPLLFTQVDPATGAERFPGTDPVAVDRDRAADWGFADTVANEIELRLRALGEEMTRGTYADALALADHAVEHRHEAPRALEVAEDLYLRAEAYDPDDPRPGIGLARCYEAGFEFERAFEKYADLLQRFGNRAEVHARLGALEARFLLHESAEERLRRAVAIDRGSWVARRELGRFLLDGGRAGEAAQHLEEASRLVPNDPDHLDERVGVRVELADAELALGRVAEARTLYARALIADPGAQRARAGWISCGWLAPGGGANGSPAVPEAPEDETPGADLLLARGIAALVEGDYERALDRLRASERADPLGAHRARRALSFLAEVTGHPEEAESFVAAALEVVPGDAWSLFQQGRLQAAGENVEDARRSFLAALDEELEFPDALAALGEMSYRLGRHGDAELYLERAVALEPESVELHALRGLNLLRLGSVSEARDAFDHGSASADPVCRAGLAWCEYLSGDSQEAQVQLRQLVDARRNMPEDDPVRAWAERQIERIGEHEEKALWTDRFERRKLLNDWDARDTASLSFGIEDGEVVLEGVFDAAGTVSLVQRRLPDAFVAAEANVWISPETMARVGLFAAREQERRGRAETVAEASVARHQDGSLQVRLLRQGNDPVVVDMEQPFPTGQWVRLRIERTGEASRARVTLYMDGVPLVEGAAMAALGHGSTPVVIGFFAEGEPGRRVEARLDDFRIVQRERR